MLITDHNPEIQKILTVKNIQAKLYKENEKLKQKFDILFEMAQNQTVEYDDVKQELKRLQKLIRKSPLYQDTKK